MTCHTGSFRGYTLHRTAVTKEDKGVVVDEVIAWLVEGRGSVCLGDGQTDRVCEALSQRSRGDFNTWCIVCFRVTGGYAIDTLNRSASLRVSCGELHSLERL